MKRKIKALSKSLFYAALIFLLTLLGEKLQAKRAGKPFAPEWIPDIIIAIAVGVGIYLVERKQKQQYKKKKKKYYRR
ncbi:MAG: hypothetical protein IJL85_07090 [Erysipelotrichaceae bacterium]|nr:hypothetical protein [Erysipelotrichaceae bacterium]